ncbi:hypothetical protein C8Q76DRAFT_802208 [Earliella scabrosa]|nr:hypothetical protein C8Q76DRAFT_802208 [Earliella scabrosa]
MARREFRVNHVAPSPIPLRSRQDHVLRELMKDVLTSLLQQMKRKYSDLHAVDAKGPLNDGPKNESELWVPRTVITTGGYD